ncbi:MAG: hypothetical protein NTZ55_04850 [Candidatus Roizmanbacteria bacterium]|nr:hypothetical protein [Candidatus Roizmanbacteria bacterium]
MMTIVGGPMFSGKTTWLIDHIANLAPGSFILFKPDIDTRFGKNICVTHHGKSYPATNLSVKNPKFPRMSNKITTILIDELNFFSPKNVLPEIISHQEKWGGNIIGAGLLYDYKKMPFGATLSVSKIADSFIQLYATCDLCTKNANHSYRKSDDNKQFLLGAGDLYGACCESCWEILNK